MNQILQKASKYTIPSDLVQKQKSAIVEQAVNLVQKQASGYSQVTGIEVVGSYAKGTWLPKKADIDIFVKFHVDTPEKEFVELGKKIGFASLKDFKPYVRYAEHPFVEAQIKDTKVNVVPCYDVQEGSWKSSADRSPFHTKFMIKSLTDTMKNEVRLLKAFLKANEIYGAEIAKQGFSGYVAEVLVLNFGSFENVLKAISELKPGQVIGNTTKSFDTKIVIIDPIDQNRNLGAAISIENIGRFVLASRAFLRKPSVSLFASRKGKSKMNIKNVLIISFKYKQRSPDIIWGQIKRTTTSLATQMNQAGFFVLKRSSAITEDNTAACLFLLQSTRLDDLQERIGPEFFVADHVEKFIAANKKKSLTIWINDDGKVCSLQKRQNTDAVQFLRKLIQNNIEKAGVPAGLKSEIKKFKITSGNIIKNKSIKEAAKELVSIDETIFSSK
ncbi:MAG: CCA tRNA nucleotidyltransferase [Nitrososphaeria archaeon]|nr:CCA tRNA nucleotidyltransferase [Nitrosopumilaceae archaeon]NDF28997.1 CCA tRNA nucleotidyltransferase [Nitrososphaeria archaeon]NDF47024.1 CCA tRNA nucleotidyltransferase [Nitrosopumilaceae archaeon]